MVLWGERELVNFFYPPRGASDMITSHFGRIVTIETATSGDFQEKTPNFAIRGYPPTSNQLEFFCVEDALDGGNGYIVYTFLVSPIGGVA